MQRSNRERRRPARLQESVEEGVSPTQPVRSEDGDVVMHDVSPSPSPAPIQHSDQPGNLGVLAAIGERASQRRVSQSQKRGASNWAADEDAELLQLAGQYHRSWKHVLKRSALLATNHRTQAACRARYAALQAQYKRRRRQQVEQQALAAAASSSNPRHSPVVLQQSDDPGEGLGEIAGIESQLSPVHRSESDNDKT